MISLLVIALLAQTPHDHRTRENRRTGGRGPTVSQYAFFEAFPSSGAGTSGVCSTTAPTGARGESLSFSRASSATCTKTATGGLATTGIADGDLVLLSSGQPRVEYDSNGVLGLLVEAARTNSCLRSEEFDNAAWTKGGSGVAAASVTANYATAPDGTTTADRVQFAACPTSGNYSVVYQVAAKAAGVGAASVFCRGTSASATISVCAYGGAGAATNCTQVTCSPDSWSRPIAIGTVAHTGIVIGCDNEGWTGGGNTGAADVLLWGGDVEAGAYATSYIPTAGATVARAADDATFVLSPTLGNFSLAANFQTPSTAPVMRLHGALLRSPDDGVNFIGSYQDAPNFRGQFVSTAGTTTVADGATATTGRAASYFDGTLVGACINSTCTTAAKGSFSLANFTGTLAIRVGAYSTTNGNIDGIQTRICFQPDSPTRCR